MNRKIEMYRDRANWNEETRRFAEEKIRELEAYENFQRVLEELEKKAGWNVPKGFSQQSVREDRDSS